MSTFMGLAWIDLVAGADGEAVLAELRAGAALQPQRPHGFALEVAAAAQVMPDGRQRILAGSGGNYGQLADLVVWLAEHTGLVSHAFVTFDHDEYGAEHIVIDTDESKARRIYHYFAYPRAVESDVYLYVDDPPALVQVPGIERPVTGEDPGVIVDGRLARFTIAAHYRVPVAVVDQAAALDAFAYEHSGSVGGPCAHWCDALGLAWPE